MLNKMIQRMGHEEKGFTLIELLIVVAIIGILAAIAIPNFLNARGKAQLSAVKADLKNLSTSLESYQTDQNLYPISTTGLQPDYMVTLPTPTAGDYRYCVDSADNYNEFEIHSTSSFGATGSLLFVKVTNAAGVVTNGTAYTDGFATCEVIS